MVMQQLPPSNGNQKIVTAFRNTLIVGAGPAAIQVAVDMTRGWSSSIGMVNRKSAHTSRLQEELAQHNSLLTVIGQGEKCQSLTGKAQIQHFHCGYESIDDIWQTMILCTPSDSYCDIIQALKVDTLKALRTIILLSPAIGSNLLVNSMLKQSQERIEVISLSNYYAATKLASPHVNVRIALTKAVKKHISIATSKPNSATIFAVHRFITSLGLQCTIASSTIEAESKNITTYVHPPFFLNDFSLQEVFSTKPSQKYLYRLYPEGPITQHTIRTMVLFWKEVSHLLRSLGVQPLNLLQFLNDENYPVHELTLSRADIENFATFDQTKQEYLLYIRYSALLIDPFSQPDARGRYFAFSAVSYTQVTQDSQGKWQIPRIPFEDYRKLKLLFALARKRHIDMPVTANLIALFEHKLQCFIDEYGKDAFHTDIFTDTTQHDAASLLREMENQH